MKIASKKWMILFISFFALLLIISYVVKTVEQIEQIVPSEEKYSDLVNLQSDTFVLSFVKGNKSLGKISKNQKLIQQFHYLTAKKITHKISKRKGRKLQDGYLLRITYDTDKGRDVIIDNQGRIFGFVSKSEIRDKSEQNLYWWRINRLYDGSSFLFYYTEPDSKIVEIAKAFIAEKTES